MEVLRSLLHAWIASIVLVYAASKEEKEENLHVANVVIEACKCSEIQINPGGERAAFCTRTRTWKKIDFLTRQQQQACTQSYAGMARNTNVISLGWPRQNPDQCSPESLARLRLLLTDDPHQTEDNWGVVLLFKCVT